MSFKLLLTIIKQNKSIVWRWWW